jgi:hypothetical protein
LRNEEKEMEVETIGRRGGKVAGRKLEQIG